jgi:hypothetical protein
MDLPLRILVKQGVQWLRTVQVPVYPDRRFGSPSCLRPAPLVPAISLEPPPPVPMFPCSLREHVHSTRPGAMDLVDDRSHRRVAPLSIPRPGAPPAVLPESSPRNGIPADCQLEVCVYPPAAAPSVAAGSCHRARTPGSSCMTLCLST